MSRLNERARIVLTAILLCLALGATIFFGIQAVQAIKRFEQSRALVGDVHTIRPWMTIPYISHVYHVPEGYLYEWLHITQPQTVHRASLRALAQRYNRPLDNLIRDVQDAILAYRKQHPHRTPPGGHTNEPTLQERKKT